MRKLPRMRWLFLLLVAISILGCSGKGGNAELKSYVENVKKRRAGPIEPLPEVKPYEGFVYTAQNLRSPFEPSEPKAQEIDLSKENMLRPDMDRRREPLEAFPLDSLRMVGTLEKDGKRWAIITDTDGSVHRVTIGNYVGQNFGKINSISDDKMDITEVIPDGQGGWQERKAYMALIEK